MERKFAVISDDLTGANGMAGSLANFCNVAVVNYDKLYLQELESFECLVINTKSRNIPGIEAEVRVRATLKYLKEHKYLFGKRIDSALRGNLENELTPLLEEGGILVLTDTIPEYGRYTQKGFTVMEGFEPINIASRLGNIRSIIINLDELDKLNLSKLDRVVIIVDSKTNDDIQRLALWIYENRLIPVDPLPLLNNVAKLHLGKDKSVRTRRVITPGELKRICYVIGSTHERTIRQIEFAKDHGIPTMELKHLSDMGYSYYAERMIIHFDYFKYRNLIDDKLITFLTKFDALVLSGGETANSILEASNGLFIEGLGEISPLIGVGIIRGGLLDGKIVVTKGGFIGGDDAYLKILNFLGSIV